MACDLSHDVKPVFEPMKFAASRRWEDCDFAVFALIAVLRYGFAKESETRLSVVCTVVFMTPAPLEESRRTAYS
jgi:hypothetical protein